MGPRNSIFSVLLPLLILLPSLVACGDRPIGTAYVLDDRVPVFAGPREEGQPAGHLNIDAPISILKKSVPDELHGKKRRWYRVEAAGLKGYVSYDEEILRKRFISFRPAQPGMKGFILASALRLREHPGLSARTLRALKHGEIVDVLKEGSVHQLIDGKSDTWLEVRTKEGKIGYSYAGYMYRGKDFSGDWKKVQNIQPLNGYICITADRPVYYGDVVKKEIVKKGLDPERGYQLPELLAKKGECMTALKQARIDGKKYYGFEMRRCTWGECVDQVNGWVAEDHAIYTADFFEFELRKAPEEHHDLLRAIAAGRPKEEYTRPLRPASAKIEPIQLGSGEGDTEHFLVEMDIGFHFILDSAFVLARSERGYEYLGEFDNATFVRYEDRHFLVSSEVFRISLAYSIHEYTGDGFREIFQNGEDMYEDGVIEFKPPYLTVIENRSMKSGGGTRRYRLVNEGFKEISFEPLKPATPADPAVPSQGSSGQANQPAPTS